MRLGTFVLAFCLLLALSISGCQQLVPHPLDPEQIEKVSILNTSEDFDGENIAVTMLVDSKFSFPLPLNTTYSDIGLYMNDVKVGDVASIKPSKLEANGITKIEVLVGILNESLVEWWVSHIENNETTNIILRSDIVYNLGTSLLKLMHQKESKLETELLKNLNFVNKRLEAKGYAIDVSIKSKWGNVTLNSTEIIHNLTVYNPMDKQVEIKSVICSLYLNNIKMTDTDYCSINSAVIVQPKSSTNLLITESINNSKLRKWWKSHITNGESSSFAAKIVLNAGVGGDITNFTLVDSKYEFRTDILGKGGG